MLAQPWCLEFESHPAQQFYIVGLRRDGTSDRKTDAVHEFGMRLPLHSLKRSRVDGNRPRMGLPPPQSLRFDFKNIDQLGVRLQQRLHSSKPCHTDTNLRKSHGRYCGYAASVTSREAGSITNSRTCINPPCHPECRSLSSTACEAFASPRSSFSRSEATETGNVTRIGPCLFAHTVLEAIEPPFSGRTALLSHFRGTIHENSGPRSQNVSHTPTA